MRKAMVILALLAGCNGAEEPGDDPGRVVDVEENACGADGYQGLLGSNIAAVTLPADLNQRIIAPGTMVTMDYIPTRLNIRTDAEGVIVEVYCG